MIIFLYSYKEWPFKPHKKHKWKLHSYRGHSLPTIANKDNKFQHLQSYSEYYEDLILYIILSDIEKGFYIDIGAYDPNKVSVTKMFYLKGWHGINIEPLSDQIKKFYLERPNDINLQLVVGKEEGNVTFYIDDQCSTVLTNYSKGAKNKTIIKMDTMSNICKRYVPKGTEVDFCKIDIEGGERDALLGYDFINYRTKVFCIESTIPKTRIPNHQLWENILIENNYSYVYTRGVNRYYVNNNMPNLLEKAKNITRELKIKFNKYI